MIGGDLYGHLMSTRIFNLIMNEIFICRASENYEKSGSYDLHRSVLVPTYKYCTSPMFHMQIVISITCWCLVDTSRIFVYPSYYVMGRYHESSYVILLISKPFSLGLMKAKNCMIFMYLNDIENKKYHQVRTHIKNGEVLIIDTPMVLKRNYGTNPTLV